MHLNDIFAWIWAIIFGFHTHTPLRDPKATVHHWTFNQTWVNVNPDGKHERPMIGWNGTWPLPVLRAKEGDTVKITLLNNINETTLLHFHGLFQRGLNQMDGAAMVSQCPIAPGETFTYEFTLTQLGTYWYHSHLMSQYGDGLRGMFIVESAKKQNWTFDEEVALSLADHYHCKARKCLNSIREGSFGEMNPALLLLNETTSLEWKVEPTKTYLLRIANTGVMAGRYFNIEDHEMVVVEVDGVWVEPTPAKLLHITPGQRMSILVKTKKAQPGKNFVIGVFIDPNTTLGATPEQEAAKDLVDKQGKRRLLLSDAPVIREEAPAANPPVGPDGFPVAPPPFKNPAYTPEFNQTGYLVYNDSLPKNAPIIPVSTFNISFQDDEIVPTHDTVMLPEADYQINLRVDTLPQPYTAPSAKTGMFMIWHTFNGKTYNAPQVPSLFTAMAAPKEEKINLAIYGNSTSSYILGYNETVELVIKNTDEMRHPMHMHGHNFQIIEKDGKRYNNSCFPVRDTVALSPFGSLTLRFRADNPGVWLFHCHLEYHMDQGLGITFVEAPDHIHEKLTEDQYRMCRLQNISMDANAAGHKEWSDMTGEAKMLWEY